MHHGRGQAARLAAALVGAAALAGACTGKATPQRREGSAAAVEVVTTPTAGPPPRPGDHATSPGAQDRPGGPVTDEREPNDDDGAASPLAPGSIVRGRIDHDGDVDRYAITVAADGALALSLTGVDGVDLVLALTDPTGAVIATSDRGGARVREGLPNLGVRAGRYVATVRAARAAHHKPKKGAGAPPPAPPSAVYELAAEVAPPAEGYEREPDEDRGAAGDLILTQPAHGYLGWTGDVDVWKLSVEALSAKDALDLEVTAIDGVALTLELADGVGGKLLTRKAGRGEPLLVRGVRPSLAAGAPPFHYVTLRGDHSNPETAYQLTARGRVLGPDDELEPDDTPAQAMALTAAATTTVHATWTPGDTDCFAIAKRPAARQVEVAVDTPGGADLAVELKIDGKVVAASDHAGLGVAEQLSFEVPAGAAAIVVVRGAAKGGGGEGGYELVVKDAGVDAMPTEDGDDPQGTTP